MIQAGLESSESRFGLFPTFSGESRIFFLQRSAPYEESFKSVSASVVALRTEDVEPFVGPEGRLRQRQVGRQLVSVKRGEWEDLQFKNSSEFLLKMKSFNVEHSCDERLL